jgi:hypothetical protein
LLAAQRAGLRGFPPPPPGKFLQNGGGAASPRGGTGMMTTGVGGLQLAVLKKLIFIKANINIVLNK